MQDNNRKILDFSARNAGPFENIDVPLDNQGFVLVRGHNLDDGGSNGAGKSTLFDLIAHTYTGITSKKMSKNDFLNLKDPSNYEVESRFSIDGNEYLIQEHRKLKGSGTGLKLFENGNEITPQTKLDDCRKLILEKLQLRQEEFFGHLYLTQKFNHVMVHGTPSEKKKYLSTYFELSDIFNMIDSNKVNMGNINLPDESALVDMLSSINNQLSSIPSENDILQEISELTATNNNKQTKMLGLSQDRSNILRSIEISETRSNLINRLRLLNISDDLSGASILFDESVSALNRFVSELEANNKNKETLNRLSTLKSQIDNAGPISDNIASVRSELYDLMQKVPLLEAKNAKKIKLLELPNVDSSFKDLSLLLDQYEYEYEQFFPKLRAVEGEIERISSIGNSCYTCHRPIDQETKDEMLSSRRLVVTELSEYVSDLKDKLNKLRVDLKTVEERMLIELEISGLPDGDLQDVVYKISALNQVVTSFDFIQPLIIEYNTIISTIPENLEILDTQGLEGEIAKLQKEIPLLREARDFYLSNKDFVEVPSTDLVLIDEVIQNLRNEMSEISLQIAIQNQLLSQRRTLESQSEQINNKLSNMTSEKERFRILTAMGSSLEAIKKQRLRESSEVLTKVLPEYIKHLFCNRDIDLEISDNVDSFDLFLIKSGQKIPMNYLSGGQCKRIGLAIAFAFAKLSRKPSNLFIADEPYKDLDPNGRQACYELMRELKISTVLMTSHDTDQNNSRKYNQEWVITMKDGKSSISMNVINPL